MRNKIYWFNTLVIALSFIPYTWLVVELTLLKVGYLYSAFWSYLVFGGYWLLAGLSWLFLSNWVDKRVMIIDISLPIKNTTEWYKCPNCENEHIYQNDKRCGKCGKFVKWVNTKENGKRIKSAKA